jgi:excisionase family DNA binding protein
VSAEPLTVSIREAARRLGAGRDSTYRLVAEGRLRTVVIGRRRLVPVRELEAFIERELEAEPIGGTDQTGPETREAAPD